MDTSLEPAAAALATTADEYLSLALEQLLEQPEALNALSDAGLWLLQELDALAEVSESEPAAGRLHLDAYYRERARSAVLTVAEQVESGRLFRKGSEAGDVVRGLLSKLEVFGETAAVLAPVLARDLPDFSALRSFGGTLREAAAGRTPRLDAALALAHTTNNPRPHRGARTIAGGVPLTPRPTRRADLDGATVEGEMTVAALQETSPAGEADRRRLARADVAVALVALAVSVTTALAPDAGPAGDILVAYLDVLLAIAAWKHS